MAAGPHSQARGHGLARRRLVQWGGAPPCPAPLCAVNAAFQRGGAGVPRRCKFKRQGNCATANRAKEGVTRQKRGCLRWNSAGRYSCGGQGGGPGNGGARGWARAWASAALRRRRHKPYIGHPAGLTKPTTGTGCEKAVRRVSYGKANGAARGRGGDVSGERKLIRKGLGVGEVEGGAGGCVVWWLCTHN